MWTRKHIEETAENYSDNEEIQKAFIDGCKYILNNTQVNNYLN